MLFEMALLYGLIVLVPGTKALEFSGVLHPARSPAIHRKTKGTST
jgi:hypothetical protein